MEVNFMGKHLILIFDDFDLIPFSINFPRNPALFFNFLKLLADWGKIWFVKKKRVYKEEGVAKWGKKGEEKNFKFWKWEVGAKIKKIWV